MSLNMIGAASGRTQTDSGLSGNAACDGGGRVSFDTGDREPVFQSGVRGSLRALAQRGC